MPFEVAMVHLEAGRRLGDSEQLRQAIAILESLNATFDLNVALQASSSLPLAGSPHH
ncbi:MAG: hypothetical protein R3300_07275 [Candidatus Promineifilaceae bacterium]|nr:hypothetical protein [Candidatus Promineifilaceae bacterium]